MYEVTYRTAIRPTDLPEGAKVEQVGPGFELLDSSETRRVQLEGSGDSFFLRLIDPTSRPEKGISALLKRDEVRAIAYGLLDAIGDHSPVPAPPEPQLIKDGEGDYWMLQGTGYVMCNMYGDRVIDSTVTNLKTIERDYDGYTVIR